MLFNINTYKELKMNIQLISTNNNTNFQSKLKGKYAVDMLDYAIKNPSGSRRIVDGVKNILEDGKNNIVEMNYTGSKFWDFVFSSTYSPPCKKDFCYLNLCPKRIFLWNRQVKYNNRL